MAFTGAGLSGSLPVKLWRGERMCLIGMDVTKPEDDFVGFAIEVRSPGADGCLALRNRFNFDYTDAASKGGWLPQPPVHLPTDDLGNPVSGAAPVGS